MSRSPSRRSRVFVFSSGEILPAFPPPHGLSGLRVISMLIIFTSHAGARSVPQISPIRNLKYIFFHHQRVVLHLILSDSAEMCRTTVTELLGKMLRSISRRDDRKAIIWYSGRTRGRIDFTHMDIVPCTQMCACIHSERGEQALESGGIYEKMFMCVMDHLRRTGHRGL